MKFDDIDRRILKTIQEDATLSVQDISDKVGVTTNPCWRRIKKLEDEGVIKKRVAILDPNKIGLGMTVFVTIRTENHSTSWLDILSKAVQIIPEIVECHRLGGKEDYLLKVQVGGIEHYDRVYKRFVDLVPGLNDVSSTFSMQKIKYSTAFDLSEI
ncbi:Lrp/AsnC family transcriptional regulator [Hirschia baltica]|uniref:Transcriptional regulator, AsnC family n=1 Tax=Hirschia baltica (strain ATCC 49814 / DSM 5838 / IFAM 1418) TaxID=582402 RepID=C6XPN9_HIRBI|nr:Lrp/AsnC family transcriptional regulator [Hirschia baltica]ACT60304.1 transcriptional regulator, AsnC family [Hirschia baltica ATCC 49814]